MSMSYCACVCVWSVLLADTSTTTQVAHKNGCIPITLDIVIPLVSSSGLNYTNTQQYEFGIANSTYTVVGYMSEVKT